MENNNKVQVILFSKYSFMDFHRKELVRWLGTTLQSSIGKQQKIAKKIVLRNLRDTPPIYMS
ncbi:MAG TPA: hypothetical protein VK666_02885 [Chryseolinea sp.]|nr:hypothetical protein [Chryseolinea sp.]